ncbi:hypothetical protein HDV03_003766 [Kappamyces sp. JEL0829]|nr:hypothetical protein HDV03_003766 [Kappamyces sp. JEL0829]
MSAAYGAIGRETLDLGSGFFDGLGDTLSDGSPVDFQPVQAAQQPQLHRLLNEIIDQGQTYPQEHPLDFEAFTAYFSPAFACTERSTGQVLGAFYVKPNYPGRCSHICNGGFIVEPSQRGRGVGKAMGRAFLKIAPALGYQASIFNLVFESNVASVRLWTGLGFQIVGRVPKAGRLSGSNDLVDALVFYRDFSRRN